MADHVLRNGFCLGCGDTFTGVEVPLQSHQPPPDTDVPVWCDKEACQEGKARMDATYRSIMESCGR